MISMRRMALGSGFKYLMDSIAVGDGRADQSSSLTRYYAESGTPPGVFLGAGLADLDGGLGVAHGSEVTEEHLLNMLGRCADPVTGDPLGARPRGGKIGVPVAGFDLTFSPSKSVSVAWALADEGTKSVIFECHRRAIDYTLTYAEREVFHSRSATDGVVQEDVTGVVAASFTHWDSRAGDPQLHDHVVVMNRAKSVSDGQWRTLDSRGLYKSVVMLGELHQGVLSDMLTEALGVGWEARKRRHTETVRYEITGVPETLMSEFSQRSKQIAGYRDQLQAGFVTTHGRGPTATEEIHLRQYATLATRADKQHHSLAELTDNWRERAVEHVGDAQVAFVTGLADRNDLPLLRVGDLADEILADAATAVVATVAERHSTFTRQNLNAEAHRTLHGVRFASPDDRVAVAERIVELALERSLNLTPAERHHSPGRFRRVDGTSRLRPKTHHVYTTQTLLDAEVRLLAAANTTSAPTSSIITVAATSDLPLAGLGYAMSNDQALAVEKIATSGRALDVLVGPAGTGKTSSLAGLRTVWELDHGAGSVVGLAPSAAAAEVLADDLGIDTENVAKWLTEHRKNAGRMAERDELAHRLAGLSTNLSAPVQAVQTRLAALDADIAKWQLRAGQLVIVDEASLAGTFALDELMSAANDAGAKVLLVGDWGQLSAVDAGGAFGLLARGRGDLAPELTDVRRFVDEWEKVATVELRLGRESIIDTYSAHGRITEGDRETLLGAVYAAWQADIEAGKSSLMIAGDTATVRELNARARADRVAAGTVAEDGLEVAGHQTAGVGDEVVTRQNNRLLSTGKRWVKNGDRWVVAATNDDGSMAVKRAGGGGEVVLPAVYVTEHVELAYASTAHRAQGRTVDTAHAMVGPTTAREVLYVAATRGRESNRLYVDTHYDPDPQTAHEGATARQTAADVLAGVLRNEGADLSAHATIHQETYRSGSFTALAAEYQTLAQAAQHDRWDALLAQCGMSADELAAVRSSDALGPLFASLRDAEGRGINVATVLPQLVQATTLVGADDIAAVIHGRVQQYVRANGTKRQSASNLVAGLVPRARGVTDLDMQRALDDRDRALEERARDLASAAITQGRAWVSELGPMPADPAAAGTWFRSAATVAAYRERWSVNGREAIGPEPRTVEQVGHQKRAQAAIEQAQRLSQPVPPVPPDQTSVGPTPTPEGVSL
jgi:conjugative relaxase-like TrwC/TraI family protein